jgi:hypothetical protein
VAVITTRSSCQRTGVDGAMNIVTTRSAFVPFNDDRNRSEP